MIIVAKTTNPNLDDCSTSNKMRKAHTGNKTHRSTDPHFDGFCCGFSVNLCKSYKAILLEAPYFVQDF